MKKLAVVALALCSATACDQWITKPSLYNSVHVNVTRRNGEAIPGVDFALYTGQRPMQYGKSNSQGQVDFLDVPPGLYGVSIIGVPENYALAETVIGGTPTDHIDHLRIGVDTNVAPLAFHLLKVGPGSIAVFVHGTGGEPISNTPVDLFSPTKVVAHSATDANGYVLFDAVPFGNYGITVTRPLFYRDFKVPGDSVYLTRDRLLVEDSVQTTVDARMQRCAGTLKISAVDESGNPVALAIAAVYASIGSIGVGHTDNTGSVSIAAPCALSMGVQIEPPPNFTASQGRPTDIIDGQVVTNGTTKNVVFHLEHRPSP